MPRYNSSSRYNGWYNWETWNVALWFGNDEGLYRSYIDWVRNLKKQRIRLTGGLVEDYVRDILPDGTPDFKDSGGISRYRKVRWAEIARAWKEDQ